ncbi:MAG: hypothetical protein U0Q12_20940 [Vicinamibacterales bacterium]
MMSALLHPSPRHRPGRRWTSRVGWTLLLAPVFVLAALVWRYAVDVPYNDEWDLVPYLHELAQGTLRIGRLFDTHNGHQWVLVRAAVLAWSTLVGFDLRVGMALTLLLVLATACALGALIEHTSGRVSPALGLASGLLVASPVQAENWLMGVQFGVVAPFLCLVAGVLVARAGWRPLARWAVVLSLALVAAFINSTGIVLVALVPAILGCGRPAPWRSRLGWAGFAASLVAVVWAYWGGPRWEPHAATVVDRVMFALGLLGAPLAKGTFDEALWPSQAIGAGLFVLYAGLVVVSVRGVPARSRERADLGAWLTLGGFPILVAGLVAVGRAGFGAEQILASRYTTFFVPLPVALSHGWLIAHRRWTRDAVGDAGTRASIIGVVSGAVGVLAIGAAASGVREMADTCRTRLSQRAALTFAGALPDLGPARSLYPLPDEIRPRRDLLIADRWMVLPTRTSAVLDATSLVSAGGIDEIERLSDGRVRVRGVAVNASTREAAHAVLIAVDIDGVPTAVAFAERDRAPADARERGGPAYLSRAWWSATLPASVSSGARVTAYTIDGRTGALARVPGGREAP